MTSRPDGKYHYGTFGNLGSCVNRHYIRSCYVCNASSLGLSHFGEKMFAPGGYLSINCGNNGGEKDILLFCKDVVDMIPHAFCFKRDYESIAKKLYSNNEANIYDCENDVLEQHDDDFILITKHSECFQDVIDVLSCGAVDCSKCGYNFDSFPTLQVFQEHLGCCCATGCGARISDPC